MSDSKDSAPAARGVGEKTPAQVLRDAATLLEREGWCQRTSRTDDGRRCLSAAIADADLSLYSEAVGLFDATHGCTRITVWNDTRGRTKEEAIAALLAAADRAEGAVLNSPPEQS